MQTLGIKEHKELSPNNLNPKMLCSDCKEKERSWSFTGSMTNCESERCENFKGIIISQLPIMEEVKIKRGRPSLGIGKPPKEYFQEYYHKTKMMVECECGVEICSKGRAKHYKTKLHNTLMKNKIQVKEELPKEDLGVIVI